MMFVFLLLIQKSDRKHWMKLPLVSRTPPHLSPSPLCPSQILFCLMIEPGSPALQAILYCLSHQGSPSWAPIPLPLFWQVVSPVWLQVTPQQPQVANTRTALHCPDPALSLPCHWHPCFLPSALSVPLLERVINHADRSVFARPLPAARQASWKLYWSPFCLFTHIAVLPLLASIEALLLCFSEKVAVQSEPPHHPGSSPRHLSGPIAITLSLSSSSSERLSVSALCTLLGAYLRPFCFQATETRWRWLKP